MGKHESSAAHCHTEPEQPACEPEKPSFVTLLPPHTSSLATLMPPHSSPSSSSASVHTLSSSSSGHTRLLSRSVGYSTLVHEEALLEPPPPHSQAPGQALEGLQQTLAEWLVVLRGVAEERGQESPGVICRCNKASLICDDLHSLGRRLCEAGGLLQRVGDIPQHMLTELRSAISRVASMLRSEVSILISCSGGPEPCVVQQARWLRAAGERLEDSLEGVARLVSQLLGVDTCRQCHQQGAQGEEIDADIMNMVATMCGTPGVEYPGEEASSKEGQGDKEQLGRQVLEKSRKRKQTRPVRHKSMGYVGVCGPGTPTKMMRLPPSATSSPTPPDPEFIINMLEDNKKLVKKDGLYKFVLWREQYREEKTKLAYSSSDSE